MLALSVNFFIGVILYLVHVDIHFLGWGILIAALFSWLCHTRINYDVAISDFSKLTTTLHCISYVTLSVIIGIILIKSVPYYLFLIYALLVGMECIVFMALLFQRK